jgi:hypothetical protein
MSKYTITSDRVAGYAVGDTVLDSELESLNIDALIEGGHISPAVVTSKKSSDTKDDI